MTVDVQNVTFRYQVGKEAAVLDVSVQLASGEVVGIVGPNGSGKSTLGRLMKGLYIPSSGNVTVDGIDTLSDALEVRRLVGLVFQNPNSQIVNGVVENEVAFGPENLGLPPSEIGERVSRALEAVGLSGREPDETHGLSMADKQRVALAAVIAMNPRYLILDEATTWLEPASRWPILDRVISWSREQQTGLVLVTHRMDEALLCDRLYGMLNGRIEVTGTPGDVLRDSDVRERLALSVPEGLGLVERLRAAGLPVPESASMERVAEALC